MSPVTEHLIKELRASNLRGDLIVEVVRQLEALERRLSKAEVEIADLENKPREFASGDRWTSEQQAAIASLAECGADDSPTNKIT